MTQASEMQLLAAPWMRYALDELGTAEVPGDADNPRILGYLAACDRGTRPWLAHDATAWCSAFVNWCMKQVCIQRPRQLNARSWLDYGEHSGLRYGAIVVLWRGVKVSESVKNAPGHVGFCVDWTERMVTLLGGNQGNKVSKVTYPRRRVLAVRYPTEAQFEAGRLLLADMRGEFVLDGNTPTSAPTVRDSSRAKAMVPGPTSERPVPLPQRPPGKEPRR